MLHILKYKDGWFSLRTGEVVVSKRRPLGDEWRRCVVERRTGRMLPVFEGEGGIAQKNMREINLDLMNVSATVPPHAPAASAVIARCAAPVNGRIRSIMTAVAVVGTRGTSTDFKQAVRCRDAGFAGAGTTVVTSDAVIRDEAQATAALQDPPAGTLRRGFGLASAVPIQQGRIIDVHHNETGTIGTATRATFNIIGVMFEASSNLDFVITS